MQNAKLGFISNNNHKSHYQFRNRNRCNTIDNNKTKNGMLVYRKHTINCSIPNSDSGVVIINICNNPVCKDLQLLHRYNLPVPEIIVLIQHRF